MSGKEVLLADSLLYTVCVCERIEWLAPFLMVVLQKD